MIPRSSALQGRAKKPRNSVNGDPQWTPVASVKMSGTQHLMLTGKADVLGDDGFDIIEFARLAGFGAALDACDGGGGGFSPAGPKKGTVSTVTRDRTYMLRCKCASAYGCPAKIKFIYHHATQRLELLNADG